MCLRVFLQMHCVYWLFSLNDPRIGALSSEDRFISKDGRVVGEGAYVKYEMWLRRLESDRAGLVGLSGSFFRSPTRSMRAVGYLFTQRFQYGT